MSLRFSAALITGTAMAVSMLAHAATPATSTAKTASTPITIEGLARVEGILSYCATVDPSNSAKYKQALNNILSGHSGSEIKTDQSSSRYTYALGVADQDVAKLPVSTVVSSCKGFLAVK